MTLPGGITLYCDQGDVERYLSAMGVKLHLDDDRDGIVDPTTEGPAMADALTEATETVNWYCYSRYDPSYLVQSNLVNRWAMMLAAYRLCGRRGNPVPSQIVEDAAKVEDKMQLVHKGDYKLQGIPARRFNAMVWSYTRVNPGYQFRCIRVERNTGPRFNRSQAPMQSDWEESGTPEGN